MTKAHLSDCRHDIEAIITDTYAKGGGSTTVPSLRDLLGIKGDYDEKRINEECWQNHLPAEIIQMLKDEKGK